MKSSEILKRALLAAGPQTVQVIPLRWPWFLLCIAVSLSGHWFFTPYAESDLPGTEMVRIMGNLGLFTTEIFASVMILMFAPLTVLDMESKRPLSSVYKFSNQHLWPLTIEGLRALTSILIWTLFLIIPGVYRSLRLGFLGFVVMFHSRYLKDSEDSLKLSNELMSGVFVIYLLSSLGLGAIGYGLLGPTYFFEGLTQDIVRFLISPLTQILSVYTVLVSFSIYRQRCEQTLIHSDSSKRVSEKKL